MRGWERVNARQAYDSDVSRKQFAAISRELESTKKKTRPRKVDLYEIFCAILYLLKNACAWRNLPHDFPNWKLVNYYYRIWTKKNEKEESVLDCILAKLVEIYSGQKSTAKYAEVEIAKRPESHKFVIMPKRWIVERSFVVGLINADECGKNCEHLIETSLNMVRLAFVSLLLKRY
ncbi:MAG: transposase [Synergistaceae bacterium]|nr:transposase [Synergistaceae bacterium]